MDRFCQYNIVEWEEMASTNNEIINQSSYSFLPPNGKKNLDTLRLCGTSQTTTTTTIRTTIRTKIRQRLQQQQKREKEKSQKPGERGKESCLVALATFYRVIDFGSRILSFGYLIMCVWLVSWGLKWHQLPDRDSDDETAM